MAIDSDLRERSTQVYKGLSKWATSMGSNGSRDLTPWRRYRANAIQAMFKVISIETTHTAHHIHDTAWLLLHTRHV